MPDHERPYLEVVVGVQFDPVLIPGDARARVASGHADEDDLAAEDVLQLVVGGLHHARRLRTQKTLLMRVDRVISYSADRCVAPLNGCRKALMDCFPRS